MCAAPGTKTTQLAEAMRNEGAIVALDVSRERLAKVEDNCRRMGVTIVRTLTADQAGGLEVGSFDLALVDAPCSNTGVLARRPEARWRFEESAIASLAADQRQLLSLAAQFVRPGGRLIYSTCSIEPEENGQVARWAASRPGAPTLKLIREELTQPGGAEDPRNWHDGGYFAIFGVR
jgi:16S rRNA (cytosine967-C5)-methyltransferase